LRHRWKPDKRIHLPISQERDRLSRWMHGPVDILARIQADILRHTGDEQLVGASKLGYGHGLPLQIPDGPQSVSPEHLETADMHSAQKDDGGSGVDLDNRGWDECRVEVNVPSGELLVRA